MKIGILTYWSVANYGAWTQAYALNKTLSKMFPEDQIEHIAYLEESHWNSYYLNDDKGYNCFQYNWNEIPHSKELTADDIDSYACDLLITGSDSIWEEINSGVFSSDWHLVGLGFKNCKKIISYAASAGSITKYDEISFKMKEGLNKYDSISVRDENTRELVKELTGRNASVVLDPSLLWDFQNDVNVKKTSYNHYIAVYGCQWSEEFIKNARKFALENNYKLISIGFVNQWCDINYKRLELRSFEWLGMIKHADYVFTSTFHGLMLSLAFRRQLKFCQVDYVKNRSQTLIDALELSDKIYTFETRIDYERVDDLLETMRKESIDWIRKAITN